jgi:AraC-like DNA-binding protein
MAKRTNSARRGHFTTVPTASGGIARAAYAEAKQAGLDPTPLLLLAGLTMRQITNPASRVAVAKQIKFLDAVAEALPSECLGIRLAAKIDVRELGLLYYVLASSNLLGDALARLARYSRIHNEGLQIEYRHAQVLSVSFSYVGVERATDRHQIEFFAAALVRLCRRLTGRELPPIAVKLTHWRSALPPECKAVFGCEVSFGQDVDQVVFSGSAGRLPLVGADPYLNMLLLQYCEETLRARRARTAPWRIRVENAAVPLLPHGQAYVSKIAERLGVTARTLARRLAREGATFSTVIDELRHKLAKRYLRERKLLMAEIAWLLGYSGPSALNHAFRRWTGKAPKRPIPSTGSIS